jgi:exodeoxyribonuclease VII small subunit
MTGKNSADFEAELQRLEEIVKRLEDGTVTLKETLELYADGVGLVQLLNEYLKQAETKVERLSQVIGFSDDSVEDDEPGDIEEYVTGPEKDDSEDSISLF